MRGATMPDEKLLSAYRILEVSPLPAGAICGLLLGDMGAEVIKLESPAGDPARHTGLYTIQGEAALFLSLNRNKRSLRLDLQKEKGRALFYRLLPTVDVLIEGLGPGEARQWQIDYDTCRKIRNDIIYLSLSGFGPTGPYAARPAHDPLIQAASGLMALTGEHGGPPLLAGNAAADFGGAAFSAFAVCAALFHRERSGEGQLIQHALLDAMLYSLLPREGEVLATGQELERYGTG
ncbi:MAG: CoA transferase, partial [Nitrospinota bacterium]